MEPMANPQSVESTIDAALDKYEAGSAPEPTQAQPATPDTTTQEGVVDSATEKPDVTPEDGEEVEGKQTVKDPVRERLARQRDAERQKTSELTQKLQQLDKQIQEWNGVMNRPEVIKARMKDEGYTEDAINSRLKSLGHEVADTKPDVLGLLQKKLGFNAEQLNPESRAVVEDIGRIFDVMMEDRMQRMLPGQLAPMEKNITEMTRRERAKEMLGEMRHTITEEGVLDFEKDITPEISKFMEANPKSMQEDVYRHFRDINHKLSLERLRAKDKQVERTEKKEVLKGRSPEGGSMKPGWKATVNFKDNPNKFTDELLDAFGVR